VNFIFQPAEEGLGGAKAMIEDGLFKRFPCDSVFGMHNRPRVAGGHASRFAPGPMMAGGAFFDIDIQRRGRTRRAARNRRRHADGRRAHRVGAADASSRATCPAGDRRAIDHADSTRATPTT
jgi:metal-dependent amidase/aminoacylase/carboxypeptidase family protein